MADVVDRRPRAAGTGAADPSVEPQGANGISRRRFMGYLIAAPTLAVAVDMTSAPPATAAGIPTIQPADLFDATDLLTDAANLTGHLIKIVVNTDGTVSFALPRAEVGQGITTAAAMTIADALGIALDKVKITLADATPELLWNQFTGLSNSMHVLFPQLRAAAGIARWQLLKTAAADLGASERSLTVHDGVVTAPDGRTTAYGALASRAAVSQTTPVSVPARAAAGYTIIGTPQKRIDQLDIVTGRKQFAMDLTIPGALPTMVCRPPDINGKAVSLNNASAIRAMPGVTDVAVIPHTTFVPGGVAVRAQTFGQCIDAIQAMDVTWSPGPVAGLSEPDVLAQIKNAEIPLTPALPGKQIETVFRFNFRPGDPLETNCAIADVRSNSAEIWASLKSPIWAKQQLAPILKLHEGAITVHVAQGGGSFGRHLFSDNAFEAAAISKAMGKPVKLMWHRTDNFRQGRVHPMCLSRVRAVYLGENVLAFDQRHTGVATDFTQGLGEILTSFSAQIPGGNRFGWSQLAMLLTQTVPYNFGLATQLVDEAYDYFTFNTGSVRNIYSPDVCTAVELTVDQLAKAMGQDRYQFRRSFVRDARLKAVLDKVAQVGNWGRKLPPGWGQGLGLHTEYKGAIAVLAEIDCTPATVNRPLPDGISGVTGPRVAKIVIAVDVGLAINPLGLEAQMQGGAMDAIAQVLTYGLHFQHGHYLEGSWDNAFYTRQWNTPLDIEVIVMPPTTGQPGGAGELAVAPAMAAVASAYGAATGAIPTEFPINHNAPLPFTPLPTSPPIPQSPTDGLSKAY